MSNEDKFHIFTFHDLFSQTIPHEYYYRHPNIIVQLCIEHVFTAYMYNGKKEAN